MESIPLSNQVAAEAKMDLKEGVYIQLAGPTFETPGDIVEIFISGEILSFSRVSFNLMCPYNEYICKVIFGSQ